MNSTFLAINMDATLLSMCNAMINTNAIGAPLVFPIIPSADSNQNPSTSNKAEKESERRDKTNQLFAELQTLVSKDNNGKMSQADVLRATLKAAIKKRDIYSDPRKRGLNSALVKIEQLSVSHVESMSLPIPSKCITIQRVKKLFEDLQDVVMPVVIPKTSSANTPVPSTGTPASNDEKEKRAKREQARRDNQSDGYDSLRKFIDENKLVKCGTQKIHVLECMIAFLNNTPTSQPSTTAAAEYEIGFNLGRHLGQNFVVSFFKTDVHLFSQHLALFNFIESQLGSSNYVFKKDDIKFDITAVMKFRTLYPAIFDMIFFASLITLKPTATPTSV
ncbi:unnamed protein product [Caenorhabditis brenneri]